jgi:hypothetical protein
MKMRNLIALAIPSQRLFDLIRRESELIPTDNRGRDLPATPIPDDALLARVYYDYERDIFAFVLEHPAFPVCPEGHTVMYVRVEIKTDT